MSSGVTNIASVNNAFEPGDASSAAPVITPDGRYVVFLSSARNLSGSLQRGLPNLYLLSVAISQFWPCPQAALEILYRNEFCGTN